MLFLDPALLLQLDDLAMTSNHLHPDCDASSTIGPIKRPRLTEEPRENHSEKETMATTNGLPRVNPGLVSLKKDFLYHLGYDNHQCKELFKDVKVSVKQVRSFGLFSSLVSSSKFVEVKARTVILIVLAYRSLVHIKYFANLWIVPMKVMTLSEQPIFEHSMLHRVLLWLLFRG